MRFAILATYSVGYTNTWTNELSAANILSELKDIPGLAYDITEPGDSEYAYCFNEDNNAEDAARACAERYFNDVTELPEEYPDWLTFLEFERNDEWDAFNREAIAEFMEEDLGYTKNAAFWYLMRDITVQGIVDRDGLFKLFDSGLITYAENSRTLGSLGGPANPCGFAPDINCALESQSTIATIRVTPIPDVGPAFDDPDYQARKWEAVRRAFLNVFGANKVSPTGRDLPYTYPNYHNDFRRSPK